MIRRAVLPAGLGSRITATTIEESHSEFQQRRTTDLPDAIPACCRCGGERNMTQRNHNFRQVPPRLVILAGSPGRLTRDSHCVHSEPRFLLPEPVRSRFPPGEDVRWLNPGCPTGEVSDGKSWLPFGNGRDARHFPFWHIRKRAWVDGRRVHHNGHDQTGKMDMTANRMKSGTDFWTGGASSSRTLPVAHIGAEVLLLP